MRDLKELRDLPCMKPMKTLVILLLKKGLSMMLVLAVAIVSSAGVVQTTSFAAGTTSPVKATTRSTQKEEILASQLRAFGLFSGVGTNPDGTTNFDLSRQGTRVEALVMLIRLLGEEAQAKACKDVCVFTDVPVWARSYVAYAYGRNYTKGTTVDAEKGVYLFGTGPATAEMYCTFVLRALGYSDTNGQDFTWTRSVDLARTMGIVQSDVNLTNFWRADMVTVSFNALFARLKGLDLTLAEKLDVNLLSGGAIQPGATRLPGYTVLPYGVVPDTLQGRKLNDSEISALVGKDPATALSTVEDAVAWFNACRFSYMDGAWWTNNPDSYYGRYESGPEFVLPDKVDVLYAGSGNLSLEAFVIGSGRNTVHECPCCSSLLRYFLLSQLIQTTILEVPS
jgi:hypothetical protein